MLLFDSQYLDTSEIDSQVKDIEEYTGLKQNKWDNTVDWFDAFKKADLSEKEYIKNMIDNGEDLETIRILLRHSSLQSTQTYLHASFHIYFLLVLLLSSHLLQFNLSPLLFKHKDV